MDDPTQPLPVEAQAVPDLPVATDEFPPAVAEARPDELRAAAKALVDRWDTPLWKDVPHTGEFIDRLRRALSSLAPTPS